MRTLLLVPVIAILVSCTSESAPTPPPPAPPGKAVHIGPMALARATHTATPLPDGQVLIAGGCTTGGCGGTQEGGQTEIFDGSTGSFKPGPIMAYPRMGHTATRLSDGRILITGGWPSERSAPLA